MTMHTIKNKALVASLLLPGMLAAQETSGGGSMWDNFDLDQIILLVGIVVLVAAFATLLRVLSMLLKMEEIRMLREKGMEEVAAHYAAPEQSFLTKLWDKLQGQVPLEEEADILLNHNYDGIRELDNKLPPWWLGMFYISILISAVYLYVYHMSDIGLSSGEKYELEMENAQRDVEAYLSTLADQIDETNVTVLTDEADLAAGQEIYLSQCTVCHGQGGEGGVGPNFADQYWIHGGDIKDLFKTIKYGVPEKGMISWQAQLRPSQMQQVASFILTFQGTDPPNQKAPEGELYVPSEGEAMLQDSTATGD